MSTKIDSFSGEYRFLSNFWPCYVYLISETFSYPSVEHAYQASKTMDPAIREEIRCYEKASQAKAKGQSLDAEPHWTNEKRLTVMEDLVRQKFSGRDPDLARKLLATGDNELIEGNTWGDTFFGVFNGEGENHLGKILMKVRGELIEQKERYRKVIELHKGKRKVIASELGVSERTLYRQLRVFGL